MPACDIAAQPKVKSKPECNQFVHAALEPLLFMEESMSAIEDAPCQNTAFNTVLLVDDHPLFRHGIAALIAEEPDFSICGQVATATAALEAMRHVKPDAVLLDISLPGTNGIELIKQMQAEQPKLPIVVLSMYDESLYGLRALRAGARGYVMKRAAQTTVLTALRKVLKGGIYVSQSFGERLIFDAIQSTENGMDLPMGRLSDRELEVMQHLGKGRVTREIAEDLNLSIKTIESHRANIKEKLGFKSAREIVRLAINWAAKDSSKNFNSLSAA